MRGGEVVHGDGGDFGAGRVSRKREGGFVGSQLPVVTTSSGMLGARQLAQLCVEYGEVVCGLVCEKGHEDQGR